MRNNGEGWLRVRKYAEGDTVLFCYQTLRPSDGRRVENSKRVGLLKDFPSEKAQWKEVERLGYPKLLDKPIGATPTFGELAEHFRRNELEKKSGVGKRAVETVKATTQILDDWVLPRWWDKKALEIKSLDIEGWFELLTSTPQGKYKKPLDWGTVQKMRSCMSQVFKHAQRHELIPASVDARGKPSNPVMLARCQSSSSNYEAVVVSPEQMISILETLDKPETRLEWMLALLHAATALRPEETFGLKWGDIDWTKGQINIRRGWSKGKETLGKNKGSMTQVVMHPALAQAMQEWRMESLYSKDGNWIFASVKAKGGIPRSASICSKDYLRPAATKAGVIPDDYRGRFAWHNLRHSLATFLGANGVNPAVTQSILRHKKLSTTMEIYTHGVNSEQLKAQGQYLDAIKLKPASEAVN